jgi:RNA polymerase sigma-70 factor (sigma-E family)
MEIEVTEPEQPPPVLALPVRGPVDFADAFDELYEGAYQHAYKLLGDRQDAEDIAQEACTRAYLRWRGLENPAAWITRVVTNLAFDRHRRRRAAANYAQRAQAADVVPVDPHLDLYQALALLPRRQRDVVALRYLADFSEAQTAAVLGCSPGTVKSHAARGLRALRDRLDVRDLEETS